MKCSCGSDDTRRFAVVYDQGRFAVNHDGRPVSETGGITTAQAARCAPPERKAAAAVFFGQFLLYFFGAIVLGRVNTTRVVLPR